MSIMTPEEIEQERAKLFARSQPRMKTAVEIEVDRRANEWVYRERHAEMRCWQAELEVISARLVQLGEDGLYIEPLPDLGALSHPDRLVLYNRLKAQTPAAKRLLEEHVAQLESRMEVERRAKETPIERQVREMREELAELKSQAARPAPRTPARPQRRLSLIEQLAAGGGALSSTAQFYGAAPAANLAQNDGNVPAARVLRRAEHTRPSGPATPMPFTSDDPSQRSSIADFHNACIRR